MSAELLRRINQGLPAAWQRRYSELIARRQAERLTAEEHHELLRLTGEIEQFEAQRVEDLAALARLRGTTLARVMADIGVAPPTPHG